MSKSVYSAVIDHGNSQIKVAYFNDSKELLSKFYFDNDEIDGVLDCIESLKVNRVLYASTNHANAKILKELDKKELFVHLTQDSRIPIKMDYSTPATLGIDRIANAVGAYYNYPNSNALIIDVGTCITYDYIDHEGVYRGGAISPGPELRSKSMNNYTAKLPLVDFDQKAEVIGKSTLSSLQSGIYRGIVFEMLGYASALKEETDELTIILTGGHTSLFANDVKNTIFADSNFTLKGLNEILLYHAGL